MYRFLILVRLFAAAIITATGASGFAAETAKKPEIELLQLKLPELETSAMPGYVFDFDQVLKINSGPLKGKTIFFAFDDPEIEGNTLEPLFVVSEVKTLLDRKPLPVPKGRWNIRTVDAVGVIAGPDEARPLRVLALLTLEPALPANFSLDSSASSSRQFRLQSFVFDLTKEGKIQTDARLNSKLWNAEISIRNISALKEYLTDVAVKNR